MKTPKRNRSFSGDSNGKKQCTSNVCSPMKSPRNEPSTSARHQQDSVDPKDAGTAAESGDKIK